MDYLYCKKNKVIGTVLILVVGIVTWTIMAYKKLFMTYKNQK